MLKSDNYVLLSNTWQDEQERSRFDSDTNGQLNKQNRFLFAQRKQFSCDYLSIIYLEEAISLWPSAVVRCSSVLTSIVMPPPQRRPTGLIDFPNQNRESRCQRHEICRVIQDFAVTTSVIGRRIDHLG